VPTPPVLGAILPGLHVPLSMPLERSHLSPQEFAQKTGLSLATVNRRLKAGDIPFSQPGGPRSRILIPAAALDSASSHSASSPELAEPSSAAPTESDPPRQRGPKPRWLSE